MRAAMHPAYLALGGAVVFNVAAYLVYKAIAGTVPRIWWPMFGVGLLFGAANTFLFARSIKAIPLSVAYPVFTGVSFAVITLAAAFAFGERLSPIHLVGIGFVMAGIVLVTR
jgi:multidrug transporter EmrE-like cation transporter